MIVFSAAIKCIYLTVKFSVFHYDSILNNKILSIVQILLDRNGVDEKIKLLCLKILVEMAINKYQIALLDP